MVTLESCRDRSDTHPHPASPVEGEGKGRKLGTISSWKIGYSSPSPGGRGKEADKPEGLFLQVPEYMGLAIKKNVYSRH